MAMKKSEVPAFDSTEVDAIEAHIDSSLRKPSNGSRTFNTARWSIAVKNEIARRYREAGWSVEFVDDQRDGSYMELK